MDLKFYNSYMEIDLGALENNFKKVQRHVGERRILPVVKSNAYGLGVMEVTHVLTERCGVDIVGIAQVLEGIDLRKAGYLDIDILIMGSSPAHAIPYAVKYGLQLTVFSEDSLREISRAARELGKRSAKVQVKIETGMNRIGVRGGEELARLLKLIRELGNIQLVGAFTHFANAVYRQDAFTLEQYGRFKAAVEQIKAEGFELQYVHCSNSGAMMWLDDSEICTHARPGSLYMGYCTMADYSNDLGLREPASWRSFIVNVHDVYPGESVGYDRHFMPERRTTVATVAIGYADGLFRPMAVDGGPVLIGDARTRYLGCCMDQCFVDATGIDCRIGDEVTIFGYSSGGTLLSALEITRFTGQCYQNDTICSPNSRVERIYLR
ncbi:MAG: alanine racemase [Clostridia bacterium]|nr:alanine racemase [Clostridia bacterium]